MISGISGARFALPAGASRTDPPPAPAPDPGPPAPPVPDRDRLTQQFLELTTIPAGSGEEKPVADAIRQKLQELGYTAQEDGAGQVIGGNSGNLIVNIPGTIPDAPGLIFTAHMDTVEVCKGTKPIIKDGVIQTDGSTGLGGDDRAGATEILEALRLIKESNLPHPPLQLIFTVGEEAGLLGSAALKPEDLHGKMGFVVDSFHPNEIFFGWDGPLFRGKEDWKKLGEAEFRRPSRPEDRLRSRDAGEDFVLNFTRDGIRSIGMEPAERQLWGADSDASSLRRNGIPAITIGAGEQDIHSTDEHIAIDDLQKSTQLILALISRANQFQVDPNGTIIPRPASPPPSTHAGWLIAG